MLKTRIPEALRALPQFDQMSFVPIAEGRKFPSAKGWQKTPPGQKDYGPTAYGIVTGRGFFVLDVDHDNGAKSGLQTLATIEQTHGPLPPTFTVKTPTGGFHLYFLGDAKTGTNTPGRDLDIRGAGGQVLGPGSTHPSGGLYEMEDDESPIAQAPSWLLALCRTSGASGPVGSARRALGVPKTPDDLKKAMSRKTDPMAIFWRDVAKGVLPCGLPRSGWNDYLTLATYWLANLGADWAEVSGDTIASLMGASLSHMHALRVRNGQDLDHLSPTAIASLYDRATQKIRTEQEAVILMRKAIADARADTTSPPKILQHKTAFYVEDAQNSTYAGPYIKDQLWAAVRDIAPEGVEIRRPTKDGEVRFRPEDFVELYGQNGSLDSVILDLAATEATLQDRVLTLPAVQRPEIAPEFSPRVDHWLGLLGGDVLRDWIAVALDVQEAAPALWLTGRASSGKTLLGRGLAQLWGPDAPTPLSVAIQTNNAALTRMPIVEAQEAIPTTWKGNPRLDDLKALITDTSRKVAEKYTPNYTLRGAVRVILSSNNLSMLKGSRDLTAEDMQAILDRLTHVHVDSDAPKAYLDQIEVQAEWVDGGEMVRHFRWLIETRDPERGLRLRLPPWDATSQLAMSMNTSPSTAFWLLRAIYEWAESNSAAIRASGNPIVDSGLFWSTRSQAILTSASGIQARLLRADMPSDSLRSIGSALRQLSGTSARQTRRMADGRPARLWLLSSRILEHWIEESAWGSLEDFEQFKKDLDRAFPES